MQQDYQKNGYLLKRDFFDYRELGKIEDILRLFHDEWIKKNRAHYEKEAINSAYITRADVLDASNRETLFAFISGEKLLAVARDIIPAGPAFMNTQLFFNPVNPGQKNYWHRDIQYTPHDIEQQKEMLAKSTVLHFRVPLADEPGIELVPGTHVRWDNAREFETRMNDNGRLPSDDLPDSCTIPLRRGDLLVFSANMIHRGLYGGDRFAFDIIYSDADPALLRYVEPDCLPDQPQMGLLHDPAVFAATWSAIK